MLPPAAPGHLPALGLLWHVPLLLQRFLEGRSCALHSETRGLAQGGLGPVFLWRLWAEGS